MENPTKKHGWWLGVPPWLVGTSKLQTWPQPCHVRRRPSPARRPFHPRPQAWDKNSRGKLLWYPKKPHTNGGTPTFIWRIPGTKLAKKKTLLFCMIFHVWAAVSDPAECQAPSKQRQRLGSWGHCLPLWANWGHPSDPQIIHFWWRQRPSRMFSMSKHGLLGHAACQWHDFLWIRTGTIAGWNRVILLVDPATVWNDTKSHS